MPSPHLSGHTLIISEKPEAARRIAEALAEGVVRTEKRKGIEYYTLERNGVAYVVCAALGHLYTVEDPARERSVYPVFDVEWFATGSVDGTKKQTLARLGVIKELAEHASSIIHGCDFDLEGETIGYNILLYACGIEGESALRAKFSTLTREELKNAFLGAKRGLGGRLAQAGRARHVIDFVWGVNLSRALTDAYRAVSGRFMNLTVGRVQGPTLSFLHEREVEVSSHVPTPYWEAVALVEKGGIRFEAQYAGGRLTTLAEAEVIKKECEGQLAAVAALKKSIVTLSPPPPFNIGGLQREAYRAFGFSPRQTLQLAERLYLSALISYPRTSSQKLPPSINYEAILRGLRASSSYRLLVDELLVGQLKPHEGGEEDPAHPSIYPTGERPSRPLESRESRLADLIVRRFLSVFADPARRERASAELVVGPHTFRVTGRRTLYSGWLKFYGPYTEVEDQVLPPLAEGEMLPLSQVTTLEKFVGPPPRYNQSSLLEKMEERGIGTKTTRADAIHTLYERGYAEGENMAVTHLGFSLVELLQEHAPEVLSPQLTHSIERRLDGIQGGEDQRLVVHEAMEDLFAILEKLWPKRLELGEEMRGGYLKTLRARNLLGTCPVCHSGNLTIIRSRKTGRRFVGCTDYQKGCRASAPLPQKGFIKNTGKPCKECGWPVIAVFLSRIPWRLCVNIRCPTKKRGEAREVQAM